MESNLAIISRHKKYLCSFLVIPFLGSYPVKIIQNIEKAIDYNTLDAWPLRFNIWGLTLGVLTACERTTSWSAAHVQLLCEWESHIINQWVSLTASISFFLWSDCSLLGLTCTETFLKWRMWRGEKKPPLLKNCVSKQRALTWQVNYLAGEESKEI